MRKLLLCGLFAVGMMTANAQQKVYQLSEGGSPWGSKFRQFDSQIKFETMPAFDVNTLRAQDEINKDNKNIPYRFGYVHFTDITPNNAGSWTELGNGDRVWRVGITSAGAFSLNLAFEKISLPEAAKLFVYNTDHSVVLGAFTQKHISADGTFATELIDGQSVIIELYEPKAVQNQSELKLASVVHRYRDLDGFIAKSFGDAGNCMNNVNCPGYAAYNNNKRSVVCLVSGGEFCTGALINNTCNDGTPYVLTANHCGSSGFGSWVFRFNWEAPGCPNPGSSPASQSVSGGTQRAASAGSDMSLVQINSAVPANFNAYFSGWDRNDVPANNTYGIHHPSGDIKKISFTTGNTSTGAYGGATCWKTGTWTDGVTEPGSSGSPLFNQAGQIVGQLYGGPSTCAAEGNATNGVDYYGKLFTSWTGGGTNSTRLSNWLAPAGCGTAPTTLTGYDPNAVSYALDAQLQGVTTPASGNTCNSSFTPQVTIKNNGTTTLTAMAIKYRLDGGAETNYNWSGSLATGATASVTLANFSTAPGSHSFKVYTSAPNGGTDQNNINDTSIVSFQVLSPTGAALPFAQGFEGTTFPPTNWNLENADSGPTWQRVTTAASQGNASARKNNLDNNDAGQVDNLISPYLSFAGETSVTMTFKVAYARYNANYYDSLVVWVTADCGNTWNRVYNKGNSALATAPDQTASFVPNASQWRLETVDLTSYANQPNVRVRFQNKSGYGQLVYIDDINIVGQNPNSQPVPGFSVSDNTPCVGQTVTFTNSSVGATSYSWNIPGGTPGSSTATNPTAVFNAPGNYTVVLTATNANGSQTTQQTVNVAAAPATPMANSNSPVVAGGTLNLSTATFAGGTYAWTGPNGFTSTQQNPTINNAPQGAAGQYCVYIIANGCTSQAGCTTVAITAGSSVNENEAFDVVVFPNPATDMVQIHAGNPGNGLTVRVTDMTGKTIVNAVSFTQNQFTLDVSGYAKGIYFLILENEKGSVTRKIIKQ